MGRCPRSYDNIGIAIQAARRATEKAGSRRVPYRCSYCAQLHVGTPKQKTEHLREIKLHGGFSARGSVALVENQG